MLKMIKSLAKILNFKIFQVVIGNEIGGLDTRKIGGLDTRNEANTETFEEDSVQVVAENVGAREQV